MMQVCPVRRVREGWKVPEVLKDSPDTMALTVRKDYPDYLEHPAK
jgi:hypothetical protein